MTEHNNPPSATPRRGWPIMSAFFRYAPTFVVLGALGGLAYWGHHTGWSMPKFSDLTGRRSQVEKEDWCMQHNVPDSMCIACHPELVGASVADWCKEHGVPESR